MTVEDFLELSTSQQGQPVAIDCPCCGRKNVPSTPYQKVDRSHGMTLRNVFVKCGKCGEKLHSSVKTLAELYTRSPAQLKVELKPYTSFIGRALVLLGLVLFWFPIMGLLCALFGLFLTQRRPLWQKLGGVAAVLSVIATSWMLYLFNR